MSTPQQAKTRPEQDHDLTLTEQIHEFSREDLGPDELYDLRREINEYGEEALAIRVDIEYGNSLKYGDYRAKFTALNLVQIVMILGNVRYQHVMHGNRNRADITEDLSNTISNHFNTWAEEHDVDLEQYLGVPLGAGENADDVSRDHTDRMQQAKHDRDSEDITVETEEGPLDDVGPDAVEEKEIRPQQQTPDTPDGPAGPGDGDDPEAG